MLVKFFDWLTRLALRGYWITIGLSLAVLVAGVFAMTQLNQELLPRIEFPQTIVFVQWSEAEDADQFVAEVTKPLEDNLSKIDGVVNVESTTNKSLGIVIVRNEFGLNQERIVEEINNVIDNTNLPEGIDRPQVLNFSLSDLPIAVSSVSSSELTLAELKEIVENDLKVEIEAVDQVSQVSVSGGQELPEETDETSAENNSESVAQVEPTAVPEPTAPPEPTATPDPARLPDMLIQGAQAAGIELAFAQDITPEFVRQMQAFGPQAVQMLALLTDDNLRLLPAESIALLPVEFLDTLDTDLWAELDEIASEFGGAGQLAIDEAEAAVLAEAEATTQDDGVEMPQVEPVRLPESWMDAAAQAGLTLEITADITPEVMEGIVGFAPQLLTDLPPDVWLALEPDVLTIALAVSGEDINPLLLTQLNAILSAANGEDPAPVLLPEALVQMTAATGQTVTNTAQIPAEGIGLLFTMAPPEVIENLPPDLLFGLSVEALQEVPASYLETLDETAQQAVANLLIRAEQYEVSQMMVDNGMENAPEVASIPLPNSWIAAAAQAGQTLETTADVNALVMEGIVGFAPQLLADLTPEMWLSLNPEVAAIAIREAELDDLLLQQLNAIAAAANGEAPEPVILPAELTEMAAAAGLTLTDTSQVTPDLLTLMFASAPPEMISEFPPEMLLGLPADVLAMVPASIIEMLDPTMQLAVTNIGIRYAQYQASQVIVEEPLDEPTDEPVVEEPPDPATLPDLLVQGAAQAGFTIEKAQDIEPDMMRLFAGLGPQGVQVLSLLSDENLRLLQPEVIALLPMDFLDTLDADLRLELDEIADEFGGAGQLAIQEAKEREAMAAEAPPLQGRWLEPDAEGNPSQFQTAADILNNAFMPSAAAFLNIFPSSPQVQEPVVWMSDLTPEVMQYLAGNEEGFVANLSPVVLELLSPETLTFLLETYPDSFDAELAERLAGIALGNIEVFIPESSITRTDGNPSLVLQVFKDGDANTVEVAHAVFAVMDEFEEKHSNIDIEIAFEQASFIEDSISGVAREGALGAVFAVVIILIFLSGYVNNRYTLSVRSTLVTAVSIPLSIFIAFLFMWLTPSTIGTWITGLAENSNSGILRFIAQLFPNNITLNIMTLSGLTVAVGRVVDDSIVVLENIYRYIQKGDDPYEAVVAGTKEVTLAIFSSTVTTMAVFLPLGLVGGLIGSFFLPFGLTVAYALAASFIVAITTVPALAYVLIRKENIPEERETSLQRMYTPSLEWALKNRTLTMVIAVSIFVSSLFLLAQLPQSFIPAIGEATVNVTISLPGDVQIIETNDLVLEFEEAIQDVNNIGTIQTEVGSAGGFESFFGGGSVSQNQANVTISIVDQELLETTTKAVRDKANATFGEENVTVSGASQSGFSGFALIIVGDDSEHLATLVEDVKEAIGSVDIDEDGVPEIVNIGSSVDNAIGNASTIIRIDGKPAISFSGELETQDTLGVIAASKEAVAEVLPAGIEVTEGFDSQQQTEGFQGMAIAILYSIILVYAIMAITFRSFVHPFTILFSLPFALVGAALGLFIGQSVLGISAMIGLMMLVGVVVTNAIVLLELVQQLRAKGYSAYEALVEGGRTRLRPILMTALTAILALIPLAVSRESGAVIAAELAQAVMGGLIVSTTLTLIVVPVVYSLFDDLTNLIRNKK